MVSYRELPSHQFVSPAWERYFPAQTHHEGSLLLGCLEAAVAKLGGGVDEFQLHGLQSFSACVDQKGLGRQEERVTAEAQRRGSSEPQNGGDFSRQQVQTLAGFFPGNQHRAEIKMLGLGRGSSSLLSPGSSAGVSGPHFLSSGVCGSSEVKGDPHFCCLDLLEKSQDINVISAHDLGAGVHSRGQLQIYGAIFHAPHLNLVLRMYFN